MKCKILWLAIQTCWGCYGIERAQWERLYEYIHHDSHNDCVKFDLLKYLRLYLEGNESVLESLTISIFPAWGEVRWSLLAAWNLITNVISIVDFVARRTLSEGGNHMTTWLTSMIGRLPSRQWAKWTPPAPLFTIVIVPTTPKTICSFPSSQFSLALLLATTSSASVTLCDPKAWIRSPR